MANEKLPVGRGQFSAITESTYGTNPTGAVAIYAETFTVDVNDNIKQRQGPSPFGPGFKGFKTVRSAAFAGQIYVAAEPQTDGTQPSVIEPILALVGFGAGVASTPTVFAQRTFNLLPHNQLSTTIEYIDWDEADANGVITTLLGCRAQGTIKVVGGEAVTLDFAGQAQTATVGNWGIGTTSVTYVLDRPAVGGDGKVTISEIIGDTAYVGLLYDAEFSLYPVSVAQGVGTRVVEMRPGGVAVGVTLTMEQQTLDDFDIHALIAAGTALSINIELGEIFSIGDDAIVFELTCQMLTAVSADGPAGNKVWTITAQAIYPEVTTDGGGLVTVSSIFSMAMKTKLT